MPDGSIGYVQLPQVGGGSLEPATLGTYILAGIGTDGRIVPIQLQADGSLAAGGGGGVTDHGALTGLADDDHVQYALADGTRPDLSAYIKADGSVPFTDVVTFGNADNGGGILLLSDSFGGTNDLVFDAVFNSFFFSTFRSAGGTHAAKTASAAGDVLGRLSFQSYGTTNWTGSASQGYALVAAISAYLVDDDPVKYAGLLFSLGSTVLELQGGAAGKVGVFGAAPVVQQAHIADPAADAGALATAFASLLDKLEAYGLLATA